jgi:hypothetical protein
MKLLIAGDSFSYNHSNDDSWPTKLSKLVSVTNLSQCGCGEYKIYKQLKSVNLLDFDKILIFHTSPNRLYVNHNSLHSSTSHQNSDLLFTDVEDKKDQSILAKAAYDYFVNIFDTEYHSYVHNLICNDIHRLTYNLPTSHFTNFDYSDLYNFDNNLIDYYNIWTEHRGNINHYNKNGNDIIFNKIIDLLGIVK